MQTHPLDLVDPTSTRARLLAGLPIVEPGECWDWTRATDGSGYGMILVKCHTGGSRYGWRPARTHRVMWVLERGTIPDGMVLDHTCVRRICCNPAHLQIVTQAENVRLQVERTPPSETCLKCGGSDWMRRGAAKQRVCRPCWRDYFREYQRNQKPPIECPWCGTSFQRTRAHMSYCSAECTRQAYLKRHREEMRRYAAAKHPARDS